MLITSGSLGFWYIKESPEGLVKPRNLGHPSRDWGLGHLGWGLKSRHFKQLLGDADVAGTETIPGIVRFKEMV